MSSASRPLGARANRFLLVFVASSVLCVACPALLWNFRKGHAVVHPRSSSSAVAARPGCPLCSCNCPPPLSLDAISPGLLNLSIADCGQNDTELGQEMEKQFADLLNEELKLQEAVAHERSRRTNLTLINAKILASQYQKEADKCMAAIMLCEAAREQAETALRTEKKMTAVWQQRALKQGWQVA